MLSMRAIQKVYRTDLVETHALHDFSLDVKAGEFVARHGALGLRQDDVPEHRGPPRHVRRRARTTSTARTSSRLTDREMSRIRNQKIGFVFQSFNLIPDLDVFDNVDVPLRYRRLPAAERKERIERAVELVGLSSRLHHLPVAALRRPAAARRDRARPRGRPAAHPRGRADRATSTRSCRARSWTSSRRSTTRGTTIVMVTHAPECAARASREIHLLDGKVVDLERPPPARSASRPSRRTSRRALA